MREPRQSGHPEIAERMDLEKTAAWLQSIANVIIEKSSQLQLSAKEINYSVGANE